LATQLDTVAVLRPAIIGWGSAAVFAFSAFVLKRFRQYMLDSDKRKEVVSMNRWNANKDGVFAGRWHTIGVTALDVVADISIGLACGAVPT
jgi:hypothetical protein